MAFTELNRFAPEVLEGQLALVNGNQPNVLNVMFYPFEDSEYQTVKAGEAVKLQQGKSLTPLVKHNEDIGSYPPIGVVLVNQKKDTFKAGDMVEVACRGSIVYLRTRDPIHRGDSYRNIGTSLDEGDAGEIIRVSIGGIL